MEAVGIPQVPVNPAHGIQPRYARHNGQPATVWSMNNATRMWIWGFAAGVFLMTAITGLGGVLDGAGWSAWLQLIGGIVVVVAAIFLGIKGSRADSGSGPKT